MFVGACMRVCVRALVSVCLHVRACVHACVHACVCEERERERDINLTIVKSSYHIVHVISKKYVGLYTYTYILRVFPNYCQI